MEILKFWITLNKSCLKYPIGKVWSKVALMKGISVSVNWIFDEELDEGSWPKPPWSFCWDEEVGEGVNGSNSFLMDMKDLAEFLLEPRLGRLGFDLDLEREPEVVGADLSEERLWWL